MASTSFPTHRVALVVAGVAVLGLFATCALRGLGFLPVSTRTEREGRYELHYATYEAMGHRGTSVDFYWVGDGRKVLVSKSVGRRFFAPGDSSRMLFEHCPTTAGGDAPCGAYVWDARTRSTRRISDEYPIQLFVMKKPWSPDGRSIALVRQDGGEVLHIESGRTTELTGLRLELPYRGISRAEWAPDGRLVVTVVEFAST